MEEYICLDCLELNKTFNALRMSPLESMINYVGDLEKFTKIYDDEIYVKYRGALKCSRCQTLFGYEDYIIEKGEIVDFISEVCRIIGEEVSSYLEYCSNCEFIEELMQYNKIIEEETGEKSNSNGLSVKDFLGEFLIPEKYVNLITPFLQCGCCGIGYDSHTEVIEKRSFDETFKIFSFDDVSSFLDIDIEEMSQYAEKYNINIKKLELTNFSTFLRKNAMLGFKHYAGQKIYHLFEQMFIEEDYFLLENINLFRGRTRNVGTDKFSASQMWNPPIGVSSHGRYNLVGSSVLYLTDNIDYIPAEVHYMGYQELDIATISILKPLKILDLSKMYGEFGRILSINPSDNNVLKLEYLLTNFIAECCKEIGFQGIKYNGVKKGNYKNYALLNYIKGIDISIDFVETCKVDIAYNLSSLVNTK